MFVPGRDNARAEILARVPDSVTVGVGGPMTIRQTGVCGECQSGTRLCRATIILESKPMQTYVTVLVIGQELGF